LEFDPLPRRIPEHTVEAAALEGIRELKLPMEKAVAPREASRRWLTIAQRLPAFFRARDQVQKEWTEFSASAKNQCIEETSTDSTPSYVEFLTCLEMERDVKKAQK